MKNITIIEMAAGIAMMLGFTQFLGIAGGDALAVSNLEGLASNFTLHGLLGELLAFAFFLCWFLPLYKAAKKGFTLGYQVDAAIIITCILAIAYYASASCAIALGAVCLGAILDAVATRKKDLKTA